MTLITKLVSASWPFNSQPLTFLNPHRTPAKETISSLHMRYAAENWRTEICQIDGKIKDKGADQSLLNQECLAVENYHQTLFSSKRFPSYFHHISVIWVSSLKHVLFASSASPRSIKGLCIQCIALMPPRYYNDKCLTSWGKCHQNQYCYNK